MTGKENARPSLAARRARVRGEANRDMIAQREGRGVWDFKAELVLFLIFFAFELFVFVCAVAW